MEAQDQCRRAADQPGAPCAYLENHVGFAAITSAAVIQFPPTPCARTCPPVTVGTVQFNRVRAASGDRRLPFLARTAAKVNQGGSRVRIPLLLGISGLLFIQTAGALSFQDFVQCVGASGQGAVCVRPRRRCLREDRWCRPWILRQLVEFARSACSRCRLLHKRHPTKRNPPTNALHFAAVASIYLSCY